MGAFAVILCREGDYWYYSTGVSREKNQCGVRCGPNMLNPGGLLPLPPVGALLYGLRPFDRMIFFPEIRYRGCKVSPWAWHPTAHEPILRIDGSNLDGYRLNGPFNAGPNFDFTAALLADGWEGDDYLGWSRYVHVDELEKIEGPPPEGPF
jgi:hypothetical protein